ncbi:ABC-type branched-chain amino acid transport system, permease component [Desulfocapsa sulfexigens DSM 10523]|uniref:ABC-type branched-chain amino acid transport system, permease component n=1 Tax=Desulfocapsa sulfexigens (strain DSM 10523 / SB164P1) TaxID=1167006 RepID=M1NJL6_DESSD|nr:branched-chain amino acid ABC transporter permease [Desulfocapsa sulfexigens]AGF79769.1 ABC-type branched-chain amino acid transport system, permease component [Desulfocapsa sulfexigens DSM 10523]
MFPVKELKRSALISLWFAFLTFPIMVIKVNPIERTVDWRWDNMFFIALGSFVISILAKVYLLRKERLSGRKKVIKVVNEPFVHRILREPRFLYPLCLAVLVFAVAFPYFFSTYQTNIMTTALMYVVLGLGLNIVVGVAGLLDLGYVAFYAVGAYSYALLNLHFGMGFWAVLPIGGLFAAFLGILLGFPVLRLRGDYLAIVTLGFGEIIRLILENWNDFSSGPSGIANIPRPSFFGMDMNFESGIIYIYYIVVALVIFTIFVVNRLQDSRLGRAWLALREDEIACQAMGIDKTKTKLIAFSLGAFWAGIVGVIFAAKTTFVNPASFTFLESAIILSIVVLGGMGSIVGVIFGALILILMPEYLRALSEYRMLAFGGILVVMMVFKPDGIISNVRRSYRFKKQSTISE